MSFPEKINFITQSDNEEEHHSPPSTPRVAYLTPTKGVNLNDFLDSTDDEAYKSDEEGSIDDIVNIASSKRNIVSPPTSTGNWLSRISKKEKEKYLLKLKAAKKSKRRKNRSSLTQIKIGARVSSRRIGEFLPIEKGQKRHKRTIVYGTVLKKD